MSPNGVNPDDIAHRVRSVAYKTVLDQGIPVTPDLAQAIERELVDRATFKAREGTDGHTPEEADMNTSQVMRKFMNSIDAQVDSLGRDEAASGLASVVAGLCPIWPIC